MKTFTRSLTEAEVNELAAMVAVARTHIGFLPQAIEGFAVAALALDEIGKVILTEIADTTGVVRNTIEIQQQNALRYWSGDFGERSEDALDAIHSIAETALEFGSIMSKKSRGNFEYAIFLIREMREFICERTI